MDTPKTFLVELAELISRHTPARTASPAPNSRPSAFLRFVRWLTPNGGTLILALLLAFQTVWARNPVAPVSVPGASATTINYQGRLANSGGTPLTGTYGMTFAIYDQPTSGTLIWGPENFAAVPVSNGLFNVGLGSQTTGGIPTTVWNEDRYLEITVAGETLAPREKIRSVPIAGMALTVPDGAIGASQIADGSIGTAEIANGAISNSAIVYKTGPNLAQTNNSTTFTDLLSGEVSLVINTTGASSIRDCMLNASAFATSAGSGVDFRIVLDGNIYAPDANGFRYYFNEQLSHRAFSWRWIFKGITPGSHTLKVQWRSVDTSKTIAIDGNDNFTLSVVEIKK